MKTRLPLTAYLCLLFVPVSTIPARAADHYAAPNGRHTNDGSESHPWDLGTALDQPRSVHPGDTIWVRGGTYVGHFRSNLNGSADHPIVVRPNPGERATIDGNDGSSEPALVVQGSYAWFWGLEVTNSNPNRVSHNANPPPHRGEGVQLNGLGTKLINSIIHDANQGVLTTANTNEVYGNIVYYNGYSGSDRGHGHGIYAQHQGSDTKHIRDNVIFDQFGYGIHAYAEGGHLDNLDFHGNTSFDNGGISPHGWTTNLLVGGLGPVAISPQIVNNYTYNADHQGLNNAGYHAGCNHPVITGNYFDGLTALKMVACTNVTMTGNTFYGALDGFDESEYPNNTYYSSSPPTGVKVFIRPNAYEPDRAYVTIYNWDHDDSVAVDLSSVLSAGSSYAIRNAQNPYGAALKSGTFNGGAVWFPMTGLEPATPIGVGAPSSTGPEFNVFILTSTPGANEFSDVPQSYPFHDAIHRIAADDISDGCGGGKFCPGRAVTRAQLSILLLKAKHGATYEPPSATGRVFSDVPASAFGAAWIEEVAAEGITSGCGGSRFCPGSTVTRAQMAVFLLKAKLGSGYAPPAAAGDVFADVSARAFAASWIEDLARRGITSGCGGGRYCPGVRATRGQTAAFLVSTFNLP